MRSVPPEAIIHALNYRARVTGYRQYHQLGDVIPSITPIMDVVVGLSVGAIGGLVVGGVIGYLVGGSKRR